MSVPDSSSAIIQWTHVVGNDTWTQVNDPCGNLGEWEAAPVASYGNAKVAWQTFNYNPHFYEHGWQYGIVNANKAAQFPWQTAPNGGYVGATVTRYSIIAHYSASAQSDYLNRMPWSWQFQGSNNVAWNAGSGWVTLDTRTNVNWSSHAAAWHAAAQHGAFHFEFANVNTYRWYRIMWTAGSGWARVVQLMTWEHTVTPAAAPAEAFTVSPTTLTVSESGTTATFTVVLDVIPATDITFGITSADTGEVTVSPSSLTFTTGNWNTPQTVTVTGVDDFLVDGNQTTNITVSVTGEAEPSPGMPPDGDWLALADQTVAVTTTDNDVAGFTLNKVVVTVGESGTTDTIIVSLNAQPNSNVVLNAVSADTGEVTVSPAALTFTTANWNTPQTFTVRGENDNIVDGDQTTLITISVNDATSDDNFDGVADQTITVTTVDNNDHGFTLSKATTTVSESGTTDTINVYLNSQPNSNVVLNAVSADTGEVIVSPAVLTFTTVNWHTSQALTVTGVDDNIVDGNQTTVITVSVNGAASDNNFNNAVSKTITVTTTDNGQSATNAFRTRLGEGSAARSGGFPHSHHTDVSGAPVDASAVRSVARCDVAELRAEITPSVTEEQKHHLVNIAAKRALTVTEFKQMFYTRGDGKFSLANVYECPNLQSNILASVWGKRVSYTHQGPGQPTTHLIVAADGTGDGTGAAVAVIDESIVIYDAFGKGVRFVWKNNADLPGGSGTLLEPARYTGTGYQPAKIGVKREWGVVGGGILMATELSNAINRAAGYHGAVGAFPRSHPYAQTDLEGVGTWVYKASNANHNGALTHKILITSRVNSSNPAQRVDISDQEGGLTTRALGTAEEQRATAGIRAGTHADNPTVTTYGHQHTPYNDSRVINYNKLGGRPNDPSGVDLAYAYATDLQRNFYAQFEVMGNLERDLCVKRDDWTLCSRLNIEDQLYGLSFVAETCEDVCMKVTCSRKWSEVEDALAESCIAENSTIGWGDYVDLYINVRVTNANPRTLDTLLRIRFPVQITRGPDDLGNWNVVASDAANAILTTGVPYDVAEGGNLQYMNASLSGINSNRFMSISNRISDLAYSSAVLPPSGL